MNKKPFSPLIFLSSLGAGGISIMPFAFMQYTTEHGSGLIQRADINHNALSGLSLLSQYGLETIMLVFVTLHLLLTIAHVDGLWQFLRSDKLVKVIQDPLASPALMAPFISIVMTMNVVIGPVRYFTPWLANNLQTVMLPALLFWSLIYVALLTTVMYLLQQAFIQKFDVSKISFSWLLHPFAIGMLTVTGMGFAALAKSPIIANTAAFMSLVSGSMGVFLLVIATIIVFQNFFAGTGLGDKKALPSVLIVIPNITLYAISAFRFGHYLEHQHGAHLDSYFAIVTAISFAIETWYLLFGLLLLKNYFKKDYFHQEYYVTQWGLICPIVAYSVLASFTYKAFMPSFIFYGLAITFMLVAIVFFFDLISRYLRCRGVIPQSKKMVCQ
ncbi:MAG: hypothetical protein CSA42_00820 [Gammaproteobacteria bacterium]|nr:MAG: hypothetical protein CSA42_00820 [Gammaproteobacteria bacterium]